MEFASRTAVSWWMLNVVVPSKAGNLDVLEADLGAAATPKAHLLDLEDLLLLLDPVAFKVASVAILAGVAIAVDSEVAFEAVIEVATVVEDEEALDTKAEAALAEEVGMGEDMVMAQHLPPMLLLAQVEVDQVSAVAVTAAPLLEHLLVVLQLSMALQGRTAVLLVGMVLLVAHMTTDPLTVVGAAAEVGTAVIAAQEASPVVTENRYDPEREAIETAIGTAAGDGKMITVAGRDITMGMDTMTHAANGDTSRFATLIGLLGGFSRFQHFFPFRARVRKDTFIFDLFDYTTLPIGKASSMSS